MFRSPIVPVTMFPRTLLPRLTHAHVLVVVKRMLSFSLALISIFNMIIAAHAGHQRVNVNVAAKCATRNSYRRRIVRISSTIRLQTTVLLYLYLSFRTICPSRVSASHQMYRAPPRACSYRAQRSDSDFFLFFSLVLSLYNPRVTCTWELRLSMTSILRER